eukprot:gnl/TRDRNA2_/TRDRNA2_169073_c3_seq1.p1 gnl/TRDRNA2_/TRDRNA2_169073_c3~~gnl/TRDRNA2_/TRDRNA2_169073_c3_seq1.p1  ORF type:complete len:566 (+),score=97.54 gnl/TRDRNA2_/TRDRNA2_169073_c3_seq1:97-1794(+)
MASGLGWAYPCALVRLIVPSYVRKAHKATAITVSGWMFLLFYIFEFCIRLFAEQRLWVLNAWNWFDAFVIFCSLIGEIFGGAFSEAKILRVFRMARIGRIFRLFSSFRELYMMITGFLSAMKTMFWACCFLVMLLSMFSILAVNFIHPLNLELARNTNVYDDCDRCEMMLSSVWNANLVFFQTVIMGDSWGDLTLPLIDEYPSTAMFFLLLVVSMSLGFSNLIVAVIVRKASETQAADEQFQVMQKRGEEQHFKDRFVKLCSEIDEDHNGSLTLTELLHACQHNQHLQTLLKTLNVSKKEVINAFDMMDIHGHGVISYHQFSDTLFKMKTADTTSMLTFIKFHVVKLRQDMKRELAETTHLLRSLDRSQPPAQKKAPAPPTMPADENGNSKLASQGPLPAAPARAPPLLSEVPSASPVSASAPSQVGSSSLEKDLVAHCRHLKLKLSALKKSQELRTHKLIDVLNECLPPLLGCWSALRSARAKGCSVAELPGAAPPVSGGDAVDTSDVTLSLSQSAEIGSGGMTNPLVHEQTAERLEEFVDMLAMYPACDGLEPGDRIWDARPR